MKLGLEGKEGSQGQIWMHRTGSGGPGMTGKHPEGSGRLGEPWEASRNLRRWFSLVEGPIRGFGHVTPSALNPESFGVEFLHGHRRQSYRLLLPCDFEQCAC